MTGIQRRQFFSLIAASAALTACGLGGSGERPAFVLVHGAMHGGWCWRRVADVLRSNGARVFTPTLTGLGERAHLSSPQIGLGTHIADVANCILAEELSDVVLVGHSYAGMVITGVALRIAKRLSHLVYLDAIVPLDGENALDGMGHLQLGSEVLMFSAQQGTTYGVTDQKDLAWLSRRLTRQSAKTLRDRLQIKRDLSMLKRSYIACTADNGTNSPAEKMRKLALSRTDATWVRKELATGHDAMITMPGPLADMLLEIARG